MLMNSINLNKKIRKLLGISMKVKSFHAALNKPSGTDRNLPDKTLFLFLFMDFFVLLHLALF